MDEEKDKLNNFDQQDTPLTKEEILDRARDENRFGDELQKRNEQKAVRFGVIFSVVFALAVLIAEFIISNHYYATYAALSIFWGISGGTQLFKGIFNKDKKQIFGSFAGIICALMFYAMYLFNLINN